MDWLKVLLHGVKALFFVIIGTVLTLLIQALTVALGFHPEGVLAVFCWTYIVTPILTGIVAAVTNWQSHLPK